MSRLFSSPYSSSAVRKSTEPPRLTWPEPEPLITQSVTAQPNTFSLRSSVLLRGSESFSFLTSTVPSSCICSASAAPSSRAALEFEPSL